MAVGGGSVFAIGILIFPIPDTKKYSIVLVLKQLSLEYWFCDSYWEQLGPRVVTSSLYLTAQDTDGLTMANKTGTN